MSVFKLLSFGFRPRVVSVLAHSQLSNLTSRIPGDRRCSVLRRPLKETSQSFQPNVCRLRELTEARKLRGDVKELSEKMLETQVAMALASLGLKQAKPEPQPTEIINPEGESRPA